MKTNFAKVFTARHHDLCKLSYQEILGFIIAKKKWNILLVLKALPNTKRQLKLIM